MAKQKTLIKVVIVISLLSTSLSILNCHKETLQILLYKYHNLSLLHPIDAYTNSKIIFINDTAYFVGVNKDFTTIDIYNITRNKLSVSVSYKEIKNYLPSIIRKI